mgnify:CR=1 FL=1
MNCDYDPSKSNISTNTLIDWLRLPINGDITEVPGISKNNAKILSYGSNEYDKIKNTYQLLGLCLQLKQTQGDELITCKQHCDLIKKYLINKGVINNRDTITQAIIEKLNINFPGMYCPE